MILFLSHTSCVSNAQQPHLAISFHTDSSDKEYSHLHWKSYCIPLTEAFLSKEVDTTFQKLPTGYKATNGKAEDEHRYRIWPMNKDPTAPVGKWIWTQTYLNMVPKNTNEQVSLVPS